MRRQDEEDMTYVEMTREKKAELAYESLLDCCEILANLSGGVKKFNGYDAYCVPETFWYNRIRLHGAPAADLERTVAEIAGGVRAGELPPLVSWVDCDCADETVKPLLERAGYVPVTVQTAMYIPLEGRKAGAAAGVELLEPGEVKAWTRMISQAFGKPPETGGMKLLAGHGQCDFLVRREQGAIVSGMMLLCAGGNGGIHEVGTLPEYRRKGLARTLVSRALDMAAEKGCTCATLQASEMGRPLYEHLGMEPVGGVHTWIYRQDAD